MTDKAQRRLSNFNFEAEGSHVALVGKHQGGPANGVTTLLTKSTQTITEEQMEKATKVQVEMNIVDFLTTFFDMWYDDAVVLAKIMGLDTEPDEEMEDYSSWYDDWINERVEAVTLMKCLVLDKTTSEIEKGVSRLKPEELLAVMETQKQFEQNLSSQEGVKQPKGNTPSVEKSNNKGTDMSEFVSKAAHEAEVTKAVEVAVAKAVAEKQADLEKALELVKAFEQKEKESVAKARKDALKQAGVAEDQVEDLYKSTEALTAEHFEAVVKAMGLKEKALVESDMFKEKGVSGEGDVVEEDGVTALTKSYKEKFSKKEAK